MTLEVLSKMLPVVFSCFQAHVVPYAEKQLVIKLN